MRNVESMLKEYVGSCSDGSIKWLHSRYSQMLFGDRSDIINFLSETKEIDRWLQTALCSFDLFNMVDEVGEFVVSEYQRRFSD